MKQDEKKLYQNNVLGYNLIMGFIMLNTAHAIFTLRSMELNYKIGIFVMTNIILSLFTFLDAVKVKNYSILWSVLTFGIGISQTLRFFIGQNSLVDKENTFLTILLLLSIVLVFLGAVVSLVRSKKRLNYINNYTDKEGSI